MTQRSNFIQSVFDLDRRGDLSGAIQAVYNEIVYDLDSIRTCDDYIAEFIELEFSVIVQVALARATKTYRDYLQNRPKMIELLKRNLHATCPTAEEAESVYNNVA